MPISEEEAIERFEKKGVINPEYAGVVAEYISEKSQSAERRVVYVEISKVMLERIFIENTSFRVEEGLPEDAEIVGVEYVAERNCYHITFESDEFDPVPEGAQVPQFHPVQIESEYND